MKITTAFFAVILGFGFFAAVARGDQKTYRVNFSDVVKIGTVEFQPGDYRLVVDSHSPMVGIADAEGGKTLQFPAKVENTEEKVDYTEIHSKRADGVSRVTEIRIGGSNIRIVFE